MKPSTLAFRTVLIGAVVLLAGCVSRGPVPSADELGPPITYLCRDLSLFKIRYANRGAPQSGAEIELDGKKTLLRRIESASGEKYARGQLIWWEKGGIGSVTQFGIVVKRNCKPA